MTPFARRAVCAFSAVTLAAAVAVAAVPAALAQDDDRVLALVDGQTVTARDLAYAKEALGDGLAQMPEAERDVFVTNLLVESRLMANAARAAGLHETSEYTNQIAWLEQQALREIYMRRKAAELVSDDAVKTRYDEVAGQFTPEKEVHASHILLQTEDEAKAVIAELDGGADFASIARERSIDPSARQNGGDLGFFGRGRMVPAFEQAAFEIAPGTYGKTPVRSDFGYHVIRVVADRMTEFPAFDTVKDRVRQSLEVDSLKSHIEELRAAAEIEMK